MIWHFVATISFEPWDFRNSIETGIGGSETSQVEVTRHLAALGHDVTCYAPIPDDCPPEWQGVKWRSNKNIDWSRDGIWVLYRCPEALDNFENKSTNKVTHVVFQDYWYPSLTADRIKNLDRAVVLCRSHENFLLNKCPELKGKTWITRNAIKNDLIAEVEASGVPLRNPKRMMYASSPDRGLKTALKVFKRAKEFVPDLEFYATYGFDNLDKLIAGGHEGFRRDKEECLRLVEETGAHFLGRIPQRQLYQEWFKTGMLIYITEFFETGWITGLEAQAMGAIPLFTPIHAQGENTRHGIPIYGHPNDESTIARAAAEVVRLATDTKLQDDIRAEMIPDVRANWGWERFVPGWIRAAEKDLGLSGTVTQVVPSAPDNVVEHVISYSVPLGCADNDDEVDARRRWLSLAPGDVFLDIGACDGSWTLPAAALGANVYAIEPSAAAYDIGRISDKNGFHERILVDRCFVTDIDKGESFYVPDAIELSGHMSRPRAEDEAPITTIDALVKKYCLEKLDFIKIDIEGMELKALTGATETLKEFKPRLMIEVHTETVDPGVPLEDITGFLDGLKLGYIHEPVRRTHEGKFYYHLYSEAK